MICHIWALEMVNKVQVMLVEPLCCYPWGKLLAVGVAQGQTDKSMQVLLVREPKTQLLIRLCAEELC